MPIIDFHNHYYPPAYLKALQNGESAVQVTIDEQGNPRLHYPGDYNIAVPGQRDLAVRRKMLDDHGIDMQVYTLTTPGTHVETPAVAARLAALVNDEFARGIADYPGRFSSLATLPLNDPAASVKELERAAKLPGIKGMYLATNVNNEELDEKKFWPVYEACEALGWTIFLHPVDTLGQDRTKKYYLKNLCGNPYDTGIAAAHIIFGGVLDQFPRLGFNLPHAGGTFPWLIGRWDHGTGVRPELKHMKKKPSEYLRRFTYDTIGHDDRINTNLVRLVGADRVTLGSDYCFDMGLDDPLATVKRIKDLSAKDLELISGGNAKALLRL